MRPIKSICLFLILSPATYGQGTFSIKRDLPPISLTYSELKGIVGNAMFLMEQYDSTFSKGHIIINLKNENENQTFDDIAYIENPKFERAFNFEFQYSNLDGSISRLTIDLGDHERTIYLEGSNYLVLQSIVSQIERDFDNKTKLLRGPTFRSICGMLLIWIGVLMISSLQTEIKKDDSKITLREAYFRLGFGFLLTLLPILSLFEIGISVKSIFPGFVVLKNDISFLQSNADLVTLISLILGILSLPYAQRLFRRLKS